MRPALSTALTPVRLSLLIPTAISISQYETTDYQSVKNAHKVIIYRSGLRNSYRQNRYEYPP
jgi:hypothetical protein